MIFLNLVAAYCRRFSDADGFLIFTDIYFFATETHNIGQLDLLL